MFPSCLLIDFPRPNSTSFSLGSIRINDGATEMLVITSNNDLSSVILYSTRSFSMHPRGIL